MGGFEETKNLLVKDSIKIPLRSFVSHSDGWLSVSFLLRTVDVSLPHSVLYEVIIHLIRCL